MAKGVLKGFGLNEAQMAKAWEDMLNVKDGAYIGGGTRITIGEYNAFKQMALEQNKSLDSKADGFKSRINSLDKLIEGKRARLERQFANMESVLAGLQDQQKAIGQIQTISSK